MQLDLRTDMQRTMAALEQGPDAFLASWHELGPRVVVAHRLQTHAASQQITLDGHLPPPLGKSVDSIDDDSAWRAGL